MRGWTLAVALLVALSGCFGGDGGEDDQDNGDGHDDGMDGMDGNMTDDGNNTGNGTNSPPRIAFFADNSSIPLDQPAVFNINASDDDGDFLDFTIDADGDGEADTEGSLAPLDGEYEPFNFTYSYDSTGLYNATLNLTDGTVTLERTIQINVTSDDEGSDLAPMEPINEERDVTAACPQCIFVGPGASASWRTGSAGGDSTWIELPPEAAGHPFEVTSTGGDPDAVFFEACEFGSAELASHGAVGAESGTVPAGAGCLMSWEFADVASTITFSVG